jgi:tripartite-type tricarboxylate transporter receptor subunit TctC
VSISQHRKSRVETPPKVSKNRQTLRRPVEAAILHRHPFRVIATELPRRQFLHLATGAAALPAFSRIARAQTYPTRLVHWIVGFPPGSTPDTMARLVGQRLSEQLGQSFVIENRSGAGGNIATEAVVYAPADGYTLLLVGANNAINATLYERLKFNFIRDVAPVAGIIRFSNVMVVHPSFPAKTVPEFIAYAKVSPGKVNMASPGIGTSQHVCGELFKMMTGVDMVHVPYRGLGPAVTDLLGGQVQVIFNSAPDAVEYIRAGKLRALAVTGPTRLAALPDIPTMSETVPGYQAISWNGVGAPKNTPTEIIEKLNMEINAALGDPMLKSRLAELSAEPMSMRPTEFRKFVADETEKWGKVVRFAGIKAD